jgi:ectoine hydroxylase-related dioxygenase (phytanoyl-CoA dioxygenase family)
MLLALFLLNQKTKNSSTKLDLEKDGICVIRNVFSKQELQNLLVDCKNNNYKIVKNSIIHNKRLNQVITSIGSGYEFHDYIFIIKKSAIHTCHRDSNGDFFNDIKHPSYTAIIYLEDMDKCLGIIPNSHKDINSFGINFTNKVENVICKKGDILLFNANLLHAGTINIKNKDALRIQMKISHKKDMKELGFYNNYNKILNQENTNPYLIKKLQQNASCMVPITSNYIHDSVKQSKYIKTNNDLNWVDQIFSYVFYGNKNFYNLPNAF